MADPKGKKAPEPAPPPPGPAPRRALGRGLDALLPSVTAAAATKLEQEFQRVPVERLRPQPGQPRKRFDDAALDELAASLREQGMIQPIVARRAGNDLEIVAGERRWRAAQRAGLREVPVVVKDVAPAAAFELALVENVQRTDLDPIETAEAYHRLVEEFGYTQETLAERIGKTRSAVANTLRLLQLPGEVRARVVAGELSEGHARAILSVPDEDGRVKLAREAAEKKWSVRETESAARPKPAKAKPAKDPSAAAAKNPNVRDVERRLAAALGMSVVIREEPNADDPAKTSGVVEIGFDNLEQLDRLLDKILGQ